LACEPSPVVVAPVVVAPVVVAVVVVAPGFLSSFLPQPAGRSRQAANRMLPPPRIGLHRPMSGSFRTKFKVDGSRGLFDGTGRPLATTPWPVGRRGQSAARMVW